MANTVAVRYRRHLPGAGFNSNGSPVANKAQVTGRIAVTSYRAGESLPASKLGLDVIDHIDLRVTESTAAASGAQIRVANYSYSSNEFYLFEVGTAGGGLGGKNFTVTFDAIGDSNTPELL